MKLLIQKKKERYLNFILTKILVERKSL